MSRICLLLAAGRGERMRPLTDARPKALLEVAGKPLITWQIERLVAGGFTEIVINRAWLAEQFEPVLGNEQVASQRFGARIRYSDEGAAPLETLGGVVQALPLLGTQPFAVVSADLYTDYPYGRLANAITTIGLHYPAHAAHFVLVPNPDYHPVGDFHLTTEGLAARLGATEGARLTYANISVFHPALFVALARGVKQRLFPWGFALVDAGRVTGERFDGAWSNLGTPADLAQLNAALATGRTYSE